MDENRIIGFDEDVEAKAFVSLDEGLYQFTYCGYAQGNTNPRDGGMSYPTGIAKLKAVNVVTNEEIDTEESFIMTTKYEWKLSQFWKSLGAQERQNPNGKKTVPQGWNSMQGQRGYFEVTKTADKNGKKRDDGTPVTYTNKTFIDPVKVPEVMEKWKNKGQAVQAQPAPQTQSWGW